MGNPKQKWTAEEEQALRDGVAKYGPGKWKCIHNDPSFSVVLHSRTNIDLKDKWRNLSAAAQGLTTRSRTPKPKPPEDAPVTPVTPILPVNVRPAPVNSVAPKPAINPVKEEPKPATNPVKDIPETKIGSRGNDTIGIVFEALRAPAVKKQGMDIISIVNYIEQRITIESVQTFRKQLGARLRRLVQQEKLEKVDNFYRLKDNSVVGTSPNNVKDSRSKQPLNLARSNVTETLQEAAKTAAFKVAEAEEKTYLAALSVKEAERLSKMQEESDAILQLAQEIYDKWHINEAPLVA